MNTIGKNVKLYREKLGLTQDQVANFLGINRVQVAYIENGEREASLDVLNKLSNLYGIDLEQLLEEDEEILNADLAFAFRSDELTENDLIQIANFNKIVKNYLKIEKLINE